MEEGEMSFRTRDVPVVKEEPVMTVASVSSEADTTDVGIEKSAVDEAMRLIQRHIDKEARNRWVEHLDVRDLCPRQKADLVADLARLF
jgi:hypothetical protein